jgi:hypothetical protein
LSESIRATSIRKRGQEFQHVVTNTVVAAMTMKRELDAERTAAERVFKKREKQIEAQVCNLAWLYGGLQGIAGGAIQPVAALEGPADDGDDNPRSSRSRARHVRQVRIVAQRERSRSRSRAGRRASSKRPAARRDGAHQALLRSDRLEKKPRFPTYPTQLSNRGDDAGDGQFIAERKLIVRGQPAR